MSDLDINRMAKLRLRKTHDELIARPTAEAVHNRRLRQLGSGFPVRNLGLASDGPITLTEEDRESHLHILGAPGEGKSKLIELLIRQDIDAGYGCCLLDPGRNADTYYSVLRYCIKKGIDKVLLIDPHDAYAFSKIAGINPIHYGKPPSVVADHIMDTIRILWGSKAEETPKINKYLPAILRALLKSQTTLYESRYFTIRNDRNYQAKRNAILEAMHPLDDYRMVLENVFAASPYQFGSEMDSTTRRIAPFFDETLRLFIGSKDSVIDFRKMISEGWVILVNLDPKGVWGVEQQRLLGTLVINEIVEGMTALMHSGYKGRYYLYIDEVGKFATRKLSDALDYDRHLNISLTMAHQRFNQTEDEHVLSAIKTGAKVKVLFNTPSREDRDHMVRAMYGGDVPDRQASYELGQLKKQHAAIKINKFPPRITRLPDVPEVSIKREVVDSFKQKLYEAPWYGTPAGILNEINARFDQSKSAPLLRKRRPNQDAVEPASEQPRTRQGKGSSKARAVPDNRADSEPVLLRKKGRATRKVDPVPPAADQ